MAAFHLAQLNVGRSVAPMDHAAMADFVARLDEINGLAEASPGYVWRLQSDSGNATDILVSDDPRFIINLTVWESIEALEAFTYRSEHRTVFKRRFEWFERRPTPNLVMWWVPAGTIPSAEEALRRLDLLTDLGPTPAAFTFKQRFAPPDEEAA